MGYLSRHNVHRLFVSSLFFTIVSFVICVNAQVVDDTMHVKYLKFADRVSVRTNSIDWFLQSPNVGVEYQVRGENWNRWSVGVNIKGRWKGSNTFNPGIVYNLNELRLEFKNYWRERFVRGEGAHALDGNVDPHVKWMDKLFSLRRKNFYDEADPKHTYPYLKHPSIVFFRGIYGSFDKFSMKFGKTGYQGDAFSIGGIYGIIRTLHYYEKGGRLDMELSVSGGWVYFPKCQEYTLNRTTNSYVKGGDKDGKIIPYPIPTDLRLGIAYHFGKTPLTQQYRWRYDADSAFHALVDSIAADRQAKWEQKQIDKSFKLYIAPVRNIIADARKTLNSWPDSIYSYMVLQRAIDQAVKDSSEILQPVYVNKGIVYDKDGEQKIEIIKRELEYYKGRAEKYVEEERRIKFIADSIYADSVKRVMDDSIATAKRNKFVADSLKKDSVSAAKRLKFVNDSIMKDSLKNAKAEAKLRAAEMADSIKSAQAAARLRAAEVSDSLKAAASDLLETVTDSLGGQDGEQSTPPGDTEETSTPPDTDSSESTPTESSSGEADDSQGSSETPTETESPTEVPAEEQPAEEQPAERPSEQPVEQEQPTEEQPVEQPVEQQPTTEETSEEQPVEDKSSEEKTEETAPTNSEDDNTSSDTEKTGEDAGEGENSSEESKTEDGE